MDIFIILLRLVHIVAGVFWVGSGFMVVGYILPAAGKAGPAGGEFMQHLLQSSFTRVILTAASLNVLAGLLMYWRDSAGLQLVWITTPTGLTFTVGGLAGLSGLVIAGAVVGPAAARLGRLSHEVQAGGKAPTPEQAVQLDTLQMKMVHAMRVLAVLLGIAVVAMATARYI